MRARYLRGGMGLARLGPSLLAAALITTGAPAFGQTTYEEVPAETEDEATVSPEEKRAREAARAAERAEKRRRQARLRDPQGSLILGVTGGASLSSGFNYGTIGAMVGYSVVTGVVPGVRGAVFFGDLTGGEVAGILWLTPPIAFAVVPFAVGELGYAWQSFNDQSLDGALFGVGGGLHFGEPTDRFNLRAGVIYRYYDIGEGNGYVSPLLIAGFRF